MFFLSESVRRLVVAMIVIVFVLAIVPAPVQAFGCGIVGKVAHGVGAVVGVQRRQARRAAAAGSYGAACGQQAYGHYTAVQACGPGQACALPSAKQTPAVYHHQQVQVPSKAAPYDPSP
jgi:hypothetical protein